MTRAERIWESIAPGVPFDFAIIDGRVAEAFKDGRVTADDIRHLQQAVERRHKRDLAALGYPDDE